MSLHTQQSGLYSLFFLKPNKAVLKSSALKAALLRKIGYSSNTSPIEEIIGGHSKTAGIAVLNIAGNSRTSKLF